MNKDDLIRLRHMLEAAQEAMDFVRDETRASLDNDRKLVLALIKAIETIGEAASHVSKEFQVVYPQIPWRASISMRNWLIHAYFDIDLDQVWDTITKDLPPPIAQIEQVIPPEQP
ncbi:MAG: DUF86 domain-containing protein [Anaerolineae bacterium]|nr:DUF86 domain-containing protein [Anaerolineae bacterium]